MTVSASFMISLILADISYVTRIISGILLWEVEVNSDA